jgi:hypothetical protein
MLRHDWSFHDRQSRVNVILGERNTTQGITGKVKIYHSVEAGSLYNTVYVLERIPKYNTVPGYGIVVTTS